MRVRVGEKRLFWVQGGTCAAVISQEGLRLRIPPSTLPPSSPPSRSSLGWIDYLPQLFITWMERRSGLEGGTQCHD